MDLTAWGITDMDMELDMDLELDMDTEVLATTLTLATLGLASELLHLLMVALFVCPREKQSLKPTMDLITWAMLDMDLLLVLDMDTWVLATQQTLAIVFWVILLLGLAIVHLFQMLQSTTLHLLPMSMLLLKPLP